MKTLLLILILTFGFSAFGQEAQPEWQKFSSDLEEFTLEAPNSILTEFSIPDVKDLKAARRYGTSADGVYYFAFSDNHKDQTLSKAAFSFAGIFADRNAEKVIFPFIDQFGYYQRILKIKTDNRVYTFQTASKNALDPRTDRFFAGIRINGETPELKQYGADEKVGVREPVKIDEPKAAAPQTGGTGTGTGSGGGTVPAATETIRRVKFLAKPRAEYTDFARVYQITGSVRVRVTFLANGVIGTVTAATELPFGLTQEALRAAKGIKFEPALRNGVPVASTLIVEYSFTIY